MVVNRSYQELAEYYGTAIVPTRIRKPKDKSAAEASVDYAETWIIAALRDRKFITVQEAQEAIKDAAGISGQTFGNPIQRPLLPL